MLTSKPFWLDKQISLSSCRDVKQILREFNLHTVCEQALCPNISQCFSQHLATFMILGDVCTRGCAFCGLKRSLKPQAPDPDEPRRIREAVKRLNLYYVVVTSPTRDDLYDGGADLFCKTVDEIVHIDGQRRAEVLIPDFRGRKESIEKIAASKATLIGHNVETVPSLYTRIRQGADYRRSLTVLKTVRAFNKHVPLKSGLMLGLGEKAGEIKRVLLDLREAGCDFLTLGQYLPPSRRHYPLQEYVLPETFLYFKEYALDLGFKGVKSSPYVRSSYMAHSFLD
jgi:lipoic acid synthetase